MCSFTACGAEQTTLEMNKGMSRLLGNHPNVWTCSSCKWKASQQYCRSFLPTWLMLQLILRRTCSYQILCPQPAKLVPETSLIFEELCKARPLENSNDCAGRKSPRGQFSEFEQSNPVGILVVTNGTIDLFQGCQENFQTLQPGIFFSDIHADVAKADHGLRVPRLRSFHLHF